MIAGVGFVSHMPVYRSAGPVASARAEALDRVEPFSTPEPERPHRNLARSALSAASQACKGALFGPVAHYAGKVVAAMGKTPARRQPKIGPSQLGPLPQATLSRPIVFVAGWHTEPRRFLAVGEKLTEAGSNGGVVGYLKAGQVFSDPDCSQPIASPPADMKVFVSLLASNRTAPDDAQPEFQLNLETIQRLTGGATMDVAAFSMGGLETRVWLDQHQHPNMGKVLFLATPHQGAGLAGLSHHLLEGKQRGWDTDWLLGIKDVTLEDAHSLDWLRPSSSERGDLNRRWQVQKGRVEEVLCLGSGSKRTVSGRGLTRGDGMVPASSLAPDGTPVELVDETCTHGELIQSPKVYTRMLSYFGWA